MIKNRNPLLVIFVVFLPLIIACASMPIGVGVTHNGYAFFVSPKGNDAWSGIQRSPTRDGKDGPFATIEKARDTIRLLNENGELNQPVTVYIREGIYFLNEPLVFTSKDSGTMDCPITYIAYPDEKPVISAGRKLNVQSMTHKGRVIHATLPEVKESGKAFHQLFVNGHRRTRARTPNEGYYQTIGEISMDPKAILKYREDNIRKEWADRSGVEFVTLAKWSDYRMPLVAVDEARKTATLAGSMHEWIRESDQRYYIENTPDALDQPGEWFLDANTGELSYYLMPNENMANLQFIAPVHEQVVRLEGNPAAAETVEHLRFVGLTFSHTEWNIPKEGYQGTQAAHKVPGAFWGQGAVSCGIEQCTFTNLGNYGIELDAGCKNNRIVGCEIFDVGAGGIKVGEEAIRQEETLQVVGNQVTDNHIHHLGKIFIDGIGVWIGQSSHNTVAHNHIHDTYYTGISVGWTWGYGDSNAHHNVIEYNHVHDIGQHLLSDMGGIYLLGRQPGTVVRNNIFHDVYSFSYGGWGIYTDEGSTGIVIENNIAYRTKSAGFHQHYGQENIIRNNIFALGKEYQVMRTRVEPHLSFTFENNIVFFTDGELLGSNWSGDNYKMDRNVYWNPHRQDFQLSEWTWDQWQAKGQDTHSQIADPMFEDADENDFRLQSDSPALKMGFQPIDIRTIGPREEFTRIQLVR